MSNKSSYPTVPAKRYLRLRRFFWYWHQRLGLVAAVFVLLLAVTGILLNHTEQLKLDQLPLHNTFLLNVYGVKTPAIDSVAVEDHWISQLDGQDLYWGESHLGICQGSLVGAVRTTDGFYVVACSEELLMLTADGELLERFGAAYQLPIPITGVGLCQQALLCLRQEEQVYLADLNQLLWQKQAAAEGLWSQKQPLPQAHNKALLRAYQGESISWERVLLDVHSGRLFGGLGVWVVDVAALIFILLVVSGLWLWMGATRRH